MDKLSITPYTAQLRLNSSSSDPPRSKRLEPGLESSSQTSSKSDAQSAELQSKDGDSLSVSPKAMAAQKGVSQTNDGVPISIRGYSRVGLYPPLGNAEDVASQALQHLQQEHAGIGGSRQAFAEDIQKRIENRPRLKSDDADEPDTFRRQVDSLIASGLKAWSQSGGQGLNIQA